MEQHPLLKVILIAAIGGIIGRISRRKWGFNWSRTAVLLQLVSTSIALFRVKHDSPCLSKHPSIFHLAETTDGFVLFMIELVLYRGHPHSTPKFRKHSKY